MLSSHAKTSISLFLSNFAPSGLGGLVCPDGEGGGEESAHGAGHGQPEAGPDRARAAQHEGPARACAVRRLDDARAPAGREGDQSQDEEHGGEALDRAAEGEDGAAAAAAAADGHQGQEVGEDHEGQAEDEADHGAAPGVGVLLVFQVGEEALEGGDLGDALAVEELAALGLGALEEEAGVVLGQPLEVPVRDGVGDARDRVHEAVLVGESGGGVGSLEPAVGEERHEDEEGGGQRHDVPQHRPDRHDHRAHLEEVGASLVNGEMISTL